MRPEELVVHRRRLSSGGGPINRQPPRIGGVRRRRVREPVGDRSAPRVRRTAHRPGAARRPAHRRGATALTRCTPRSSRPARRRARHLRGRAHPRWDELRHPAGGGPPVGRGRARAHRRLPPRRGRPRLREPAAPRRAGTGRTAGGRYASPWSSRATCPVEDRPAEGRRWPGGVVVPSDRSRCPRTRCCTSSTPRLPSDHGPTWAPASRTPTSPTTPPAMSVSLDHSVWFHRPVDVNDWLLSELHPVATGRGRGLAMGRSAPAPATPGRHRRPGGPAPLA